MNIKITIKDADNTPLLIQKNQLSETEHRKKNSLYQQPQRDKQTQKKEKSVNNQNKISRDDKALRQTGLRSSGQDEQYRKAEKKMMEDLDKMSKNQASLDMIHNSNNILQKQNQILQENQRTLYQMSKNNQNKQPNQNEVRQYDNLLAQIRKEVDEMKKIKEEIQKSSKEFARTLNDNKEGGKQPAPALPNNINEMNSNLKHLAEISKNQLEGLESMEAIKNLQNFNMQGYSQAINSLKKQIVQYQKQSEQIERQLKLRAAKLEKLEVKPNFDEQLLVPYQNYLKKKTQAVDLLAIKEKVYEKLGVFDYSKFETDINQIMADAKGEMNQFNIVCKQYRIDVPDIKIDQKELKALELKLPSAIEEFKAERGIDFSKPQERKDTISSNEEIGELRGKKNRRKGEAVASVKQAGQKLSKSSRPPQGVRQLNSKPVDLTTQVKFQKTNQPTQKTVLQNTRQRDRRQVTNNMKKMRKGKQDEDFQKYLEYRAQQQLQLIYKEKKEKLERQKRQLLEVCNEPEVYLNLDLRNEIKRESRQKREEKKSPRMPSAQKKEAEGESRPKEKIEEELPRLKPIPGTEGQTIKEVGTEVLKEKLKNLLGGNNLPRRQPEQFQPNIQQPTIPQSHSQSRLQSVAENFLNLINNTLTQVNNNISRSIQTKYEQRSLSKERQDHYKKSPPKITIPKLEEFRPPPAFNMPVYNPLDKPAYQPAYQPVPSPMVNAEKPKPEQKIVPKNYDHLRIKDEQKEEDLQVSESYAQDFD